jgi:hypothetical protein
MAHIILSSTLSTDQAHSIDFARFKDPDYRAKHPHFQYLLAFNPNPPKDEVAYPGICPAVCLAEFIGPEKDPRLGMFRTDIIKKVS